MPDICRVSLRLRLLLESDAEHEPIERLLNRRATQDVDLTPSDITEALDDLRDHCRDRDRIFLRSALESGIPFHPPQHDPLIARALRPPISHGEVADWLASDPERRQRIDDSDSSLLDEIAETDWGARLLSNQTSGS
jgi:hypothetical protein